MPYRRNYRRRSYARKNIPWYNRRYSPAQVADKAWQGVKFLKSVINTEYKQIDINISGTAGTTPSVNYLSGVGQGDTMITRNGNSILAKDLLMRLEVEINPSSTTDATFRMIIFVDFDNLGSAPTPAEILQDPSVAHLSPLNRTTTDGKRFRVLTDKIIDLSQAGMRSKTFNIYKKLTHHIKYGGTSAFTSDGRAGAVYLLTCSDDNTNQPAVQFYNRIKYIDN